MKQNNSKNKTVDTGFTATAQISKPYDAFIFNGTWYDPNTTGTIRLGGFSKGHAGCSIQRNNDKRRCRQNREDKLINFEPKPTLESGTFWASMAGGLVGLINVIAGIKKGDMATVSKGLTEIFGFIAIWRVRKGLNQPIED